VKAVLTFKIKNQFQSNSNIPVQDAKLTHILYMFLVTINSTEHKYEMCLVQISKCK